MREIALTREDANTDTALLAEWLVPDRSAVTRGQAICVVETSKASIEIEAPEAGTLVQLYRAGSEVEPGWTIAAVADGDEEVAQLAARVEQAAAAREERRSTRATRKAQELAERHGIDLDSIDRAGFITAEDVEALVAAREAGAAAPGRPEVLAGVSIEGVTLPSTFDPDGEEGALDADFLAYLRSDPAEFRALPSDEKCAAYREHGASLGEGVTLGAGTLIVAPRVVIGGRSSIGRDGTVRCAEVFAMGELSAFNFGLDLACRRAFVGSNVWAGRSIRIGAGGHRDPRATLVVGDLAFVGDEVFVNVCRPVLIGREVFLTQRAMLVTHNIGHSILEGYENRFAPIVLEDRSQVGLGSVVYAGCRIGRGAIVASNSYVVSDVPADRIAIGVPARVAGPARRTLSRQRQVELAREMLAELAELMELEGREVERLDDGFEVEGARVVFVPAVRDGLELSPGTVVTTLALDGPVPDGCTVLDLLGRRVHGTGGPVADAVREFCRKKGIRFEPGPWRYEGGLIT